MSYEEIEEKINQFNELMELKGVTILDDYFYNIFQDKNGNEIFRIKSQRFFKSQEESDSMLNETLSNLISYNL